MISRFFKCKTGSVAVETAIFTPIFLAMMLGIADIGGGMFWRMQVNAAAQAGATYVVLSSSTAGVQQAMNDASGICASPGAVCTASMTVPCTSPCIITVMAKYPYTPILSDALYSWASTMNISSTITLRVQ